MAPTQTQASQASQSSSDKTSRHRRKRQKHLDAKRTIDAVRQATKDLDVVNVEDGQADSMRRELDKNFTGKGVLDTSVAKEDAEVFRELSGKVVKRVLDSAKRSNKLDGAVFVDRLKSRFKRELDDDEVGWRELGQAVNGYFNGVCDNFFLVGGLDAAHAPRKARAKKQAKATGAFERPDLILEEKEGGKKKRDQHEAMQRELHGDIKRMKKVCMLEYLINPKSVTQTVENIFEYSFLVGNYSKIELDKDKLPVLTASGETAGPGEGDEDGGGGSSTSLSGATNQSILSFTREDIKDAVEAFDIKRTMITTRLGSIYQGTD